MWIALEIIGGIVVVFLIVVALQPAAFSISRSISIGAAPADVFGQVNDFHRWPDWSPWAKLDPAMQTSFDGAPAGEGASYSWSGNKKVGKGKMTIVKSQPTDLVSIRLEFLAPMHATNMADFTFVPDGAATKTTWTMTGRRNFVFKAFCLFMDMEKMIGGDFEKGLAQLKAVVEGGKK